MPDIVITYTLTPSSMPAEEAAQRIEQAALAEARRCQAGDAPNVVTNRLRQRVADLESALRELDTLIDFSCPLDQEAMIFEDQTAINAAMLRAYETLNPISSYDALMTGDSLPAARATAGYGDAEASVLAGLKEVAARIARLERENAALRANLTAVREARPLHDVARRED